MYNSNHSENKSNTSKPVALRVIPEGIPEVLKQQNRWVCWRYTLKTNSKGESKWTKLPINPRTFANAKSTNPATWTSFKGAMTSYLEPANNLDGVGFMLGEEWCGIDLDKCRKDQNFKNPVAAEIVQQMDTYTEVSPSGTGVKLVFTSSITANRKFGNLEVYSHSRFWTLTGHHLPGTPNTPHQRQEQAEEFLATYFPKEEKEKPVDHSKYAPQPVTEERFKDALERARMRPNSGNFIALWSGNFASYPSQSEATTALLNYLAYELGPDKTAIDALFRRSGLMREKWDSPRGSSTWGELQIDFVLSDLQTWHTKKAEVAIQEIIEKPIGWKPSQLWAYQSKTKTLIPKVLMSGSHTLLSAREKRGKTHFVNNLIADLLTKGEGFGCTFEPMPIFYLDYEMGIDSYRKSYWEPIFPDMEEDGFEALEQHFKYFSRDKGAGQLPDYLSVPWLQSITQDMAKAIIVVDSCRGAFGSSPEARKAQNWENDSHAVGTILRPLTEWCHESGLNLITIHHHNKNDNYSGSTEFGASVDACWDFKLDGDGDNRRLNVLGRGCSGSFPFSFKNDRYHLEAQVDTSKRVITDWIIEHHKPGPITQKQLLEQRGKLPDNKVREVHSELHAKGILVKKGKQEGYALATDWELRSHLLAG